MSSMSLVVNKLSNVGLFFQFNKGNKRKKIVSIEIVELFSNLNKRHIERKNVYTAQTLQSDCRMLLLCLDTLLFGEKVCVHYNLGKPSYISTR